MASKKNAYIDVDGIPLEAGVSRSDLDKQAAIDERKRTRGVVMQQTLAHAQYAKRLSIYRTVSDTLANAKIVKATCESIATEITPARGYRDRASRLIEQLAEAVDKLTELQKAADTIIASTPSLIVDHVCKDCKRLAEEVDKLHSCVNTLRVQAENYSIKQNESKQKYRASEKGRRAEERYKERRKEKFNTDSAYREWRREYGRQYYRQMIESMSPEKLAEYRAKTRERYKRYYDRNKEKMLEYGRAYRRRISEIRRQQAEVQSAPTRRDDATSQDF